MRKTIIRKWKNVGRIAGGSTIVGVNAYAIAKTLGLGHASAALIPARASVGVRFATRFPRVVRAAGISGKIYGVGSGFGGIRYGARMVKRGVQGLRGRSHPFYGNQYTRRGSAKPRPSFGTKLAKHYTRSVRQKYGTRGVAHMRASLQQKYGRRK
jgi:hypothetical protein